MDFVIRQGEFEGPLDLLLQLVEKRKFFINDISLAEVTDDYLGHIKDLQVNIDQKTEFLVIAAILILLKSRSLLPNLELTVDEKKDVSDLELRLRLYQLFVGAGDSLKTFIKNTVPLRLPKKRKKIKQIIFIKDDSITKNSVHNEVLGVLSKLPKVEVMPKVKIEKILTLEEVIDSLQTRIQTATKFMFSSLNKKANTKEARINIIVSFLAMLELVRQGILSVAQDDIFEDIEIQKAHKLEEVYE